MSGAGRPPRAPRRGARARVLRGCVGPRRLGGGDARGAPCRRRARRARGRAARRGAGHSLGPRLAHEAARGDGAGLVSGFGEDPLPGRRGRALRRPVEEEFLRRCQRQELARAPRRTRGLVSRCIHAERDARRTPGRWASWTRRRRPGTKVIYSCPGYLLLSEIVERVASDKLDRLFEARVSAPLQLSENLLFSPSSPVDLARCAGGERDDATERKMTADRGLSYGGFRTGVVNGMANDGNAYRRGNGVSLNAGLFGTAGAAAEIGRAWLRREARLLPERFFAIATQNATAGLGEDRGLGWQLASTPGSAGRAARDRRVRPHGLHGSVPLRRSGPLAGLRAPREPPAPGRAPRRHECVPAPLPRDRRGALSQDRVSSDAPR